MLHLQELHKKLNITILDDEEQLRKELNEKNLFDARNTLLEYLYKQESHKYLYKQESHIDTIDKHYLLNSEVILVMSKKKSKNVSAKECKLFLKNHKSINSGQLENFNEAIRNINHLKNLIVFLEYCSQKNIIINNKWIENFDHENNILGTFYFKAYHELLSRKGFSDYMIFKIAYKTDTKNLYCMAIAYEWLRKIGFSHENIEDFFNYKKNINYILIHLIQTIIQLNQDGTLQENFDYNKIKSRINKDFPEYSINKIFIDEEKMHQLKSSLHSTISTTTTSTTTTSTTTTSTEAQEADAEIAKIYNKSPEYFSGQNNAPISTASNISGIPKVPSSLMQSQSTGHVFISYLGNQGELLYQRITLFPARQNTAFTFEPPYDIGTLNNISQNNATNPNPFAFFTSEQEALPLPAETPSLEEKFNH